MDRPKPLTLRTDRLELREAEEADLEGMHAVFTSDPKLELLRPDIAAAGGYDLASVRRYWEVAQFDPTRHVMVVAEQQSDDIIGILDFVTESPADGYPWIGLVLIHGSHQRRGLGSEALAALVASLANEGHAAVRMAVLEDDPAGLAFAHRAGFVDLRDAETFAAGRRVHVLELDLAGCRR